MKHMWSEEEIQAFKKDISNLVDSKGNPRFVEGEGTPETIEGVTFSFNKWSLSGTHLMFVVAGTVANTTTISANTRIINFTIPKFIYDKLVPTFSNVLEIKNIAFYAVDFTTQGIGIQLRKSNIEGLILMQSSGSLTLTTERNFRMQFDLLIDSE